MPWPMLIAAGAQIGSQLIKSAQNARGKSMSQDTRGEGDAAFKNNYDMAAKRGQQAATNASMHQQMSLARGSGTAGSQAAGVQAAIQNAPSVAANAALAGARIGEGYAAGANEYQKSTLDAKAAGHGAQSGYENAVAGAMGDASTVLSGAFGGGGGGGGGGEEKLGLDDVWQAPPIQAPGYNDKPGSDERMKTNVSPMSGSGGAQASAPPEAYLTGTTPPHMGRVGGMSDQQLGENSRWYSNKYAGGPDVYRQQRMDDIARTMGMSRAESTPTMQELERIQQEQLSGINAPREQQAQTMMLQAERARAMRDMDRASFAAPKPTTSTPNWLMPQSPQINATTQEEGALGFRADRPFIRQTTVASESAGQYAGASPAGQPGQPRDASLPGTMAPQQQSQENRPVAPLRHQISHSGVDLSMLSPEQQQTFYAQNPDMVPRGDGVSVRQGRPEHGTGGMQGHSGPPDQVYYDPEQRDFDGKFAPVSMDRELARRYSSESLGGQGVHNPAPFADQPNAYSNRIKGSGGGFKTGVGYTSTYKIPETYKQMVRDGRIEAMVRVPMYDFTRTVDSRGGRPAGGGRGGVSDDAQLEALAERRAFDRDVQAAADEKEAYDFVSENEDTSPEEAQELLDLANATEAARKKGSAPKAPRKAVPKVVIGQAEMEDSIAGYSEPRVAIGEAEIEEPGGMSEEPTKPKEKLSSNANDVVPYTYDEMVDFAKDEILNPGKWGNLKKVELDELDRKSRAAVEDRVAELMAKQRQELAQLPPDRIGSDKRAKNSGGKMAAMDVFRKTPGYSYEYKHGMMGAPGTAPGKHFGPMAQDLEKTKAGKSVVKPGADGMKRVDTSRLTLLQSAALHDIVKRLDKMEKRRA